MTEQDRQTVEAVEAGLEDTAVPTPVYTSLIEIIYRLDKQLAEVKEAMEPISKEIEACLSWPGSVISLHVTAERGRRLAQALKEVRDD